MCCPSLDKVRARIDAQSLSTHKKIQRIFFLLGGTSLPSVDVPSWDQLTVTTQRPVRGSQCAICTPLTTKQFSGAVFTMILNARAWRRQDSSSIADGGEMNEMKWICTKSLTTLTEEQHMRFNRRAESLQTPASFRNLRFFINPTQTWPIQRPTNLTHLTTTWNPSATPQPLALAWVPACQLSW